MKNFEFLLNNIDEFTQVYELELFNENKEPIKDFKLIVVYMETDISYFENYYLFDGKGNFIKKFDDKQEYKKVILETGKYKEITS